MEKKALKSILNEIIIKDHYIHFPIYKGSIAKIGLSQKMTKFDIYSILYSQRSKKQRSNEIRVRSGGLQKYQYIGKILRLKKSKDKIATSILIRNITDLVSFEINIPVFSPLVTNLEIIHIGRNISKLPISANYFLRIAEPAKSYTPFIFVTPSPS